MLNIGLQFFLSCKVSLKGTLLTWCGSLCIAKRASQEPVPWCTHTSFWQWQCIHPALLLTHSDLVIRPTCQDCPSFGCILPIWWSWSQSPPPGTVVYPSCHHHCAPHCWTSPNDLPSSQEVLLTLPLSSPPEKFLFWLLLGAVAVEAAAAEVEMMSVDKDVGTAWVAKVVANVAVLFFPLHFLRPQGPSPPWLALQG